MAYLFGIVGLIALVASTSRFTASTNAKRLMLVGLVSGILSAVAVLYFASELLASSRGSLAFFVLLCCLACPVVVAIIAIGELVRIPPS